MITVQVDRNEIIILLNHYSMAMPFEDAQKYVEMGIMKYVNWGHQEIPKTYFKNDFLQEKSDEELVAFYYSIRNLYNKDSVINNS